MCKVDLNYGIGSIYLYIYMVFPLRICQDMLGMPTNILMQPDFLRDPNHWKINPFERLRNYPIWRFRPKMKGYISIQNRLSFGSKSRYLSIDTCWYMTYNDVETYWSLAPNIQYPHIYIYIYIDHPKILVFCIGVVHICGPCLGYSKGG